MKQFEKRRTDIFFMKFDIEEFYEKFPAHLISVEIGQLKRGDTRFCACVTKYIRDRKMCRTEFSEKSEHMFNIQ
jgi:hypothetical protein